MKQNMHLSSSLQQFIQHLANKRMLICLFLGFTSGFPYYVLAQYLPGWMEDSSFSLQEIGLITLAQLPFTWKFVWAPLMERFKVPLLGRRKGWIFLTQVVLGLLMLALTTPFASASSSNLMVIAFGIGFFSSSADVVIDAYRREILPDSELGVGNAFHVNAWRLAGLVPGGLALIMADSIDWTWIHVFLAGFCLMAAFIALIIPEPVNYEYKPLTLKQSIVEPFRNFFMRSGIKTALLIMAFLFFYKLGDNLATALATPFYKQMGFSWTEIGSTVKLTGLWAMVAGTIIGGVWMIKLGITRSLWVFGVFQMVSILGFVWLASVGDSLAVLFVVVGAEYIGVGLGQVAVLAYMSKLSDLRFTATQFALLSAFVSLPRIFAGSVTGYLVRGQEEDSSGWVVTLLDWLQIPAEGLGWVNFYYVCFFAAIPGMLILFKIAPWNGELLGCGKVTAVREDADR